MAELGPQICIISIVIQILYHDITEFKYMVKKVFMNK